MRLVLTSCNLSRPYGLGEFKGKDLVNWGKRWSSQFVLSYTHASSFRSPWPVDVPGVIDEALI